MATDGSPDPKDVVRRGYDALSFRYRADDAAPANHVRWAAELLAHLGDRPARVLDLGCGCGVPVSRDLAAAGHHVIGVDISDVQVERARRLVPDAEFIRADATELEFSEASFDAVVCLFAIIHVPLAEQPAFLRRMARWLRDGGWLLLTAGHDAWTGSEQGWLGGDAEMWWSHADRATYREWLADADLEIVDERFVPEGGGGHALFWARRA